MGVFSNLKRAFCLQRGKLGASSVLLAMDPEGVLVVSGAEQKAPNHGASSDLCNEASTE